MHMFLRKFTVVLMLLEILFFHIDLLLPRTVELRCSNEGNIIESRFNQDG